MPKIFYVKAKLYLLFTVSRKSTKPVLNRTLFYFMEIESIGIYLVANINMNGNCLTAIMKNCLNKINDMDTENGSMPLGYNENWNLCVFVRWVARQLMRLLCLIEKGDIAEWTNLCYACKHEFGVTSTKKSLQNFAT